MAPKKKHGSKGKSKPRTSSSKIANKRLNKLAKQGKLQKEANKQKRKEKLLQRAKEQGAVERKVAKSVHVEDEEVLPLEEADLNFYGRLGRDASFAATVSKGILSGDSLSDKKGKKRKKEDEDFLERDYEKIPRKVPTTNKNMKMMLPIKTKTGIVTQVVEDEENIDEEEELENGEEDQMEMDAEEEESEPLPELSGIELYAQRQNKLRERKQKIALLSSAIIANPEESMKKLRELVSMLREIDPDVFVTVRKYVIVSLLEVFKDIIPGYHIRLPTEKEKQQQMKKDTISLLAHEEGLLKAYQEYLEFLEATAKGPKKGKPNSKFPKKETFDIPEKVQQSLTELCVRTLCDLLVQHPHFNFRNNIITVIVPYMNYRIPEIATIACDCVKKLFKEDKGGNVTLEVTKCISRMVKARDYRIKPQVLETFLCLRIKEVSYTDPLGREDGENEKKKHHNDKLSRREKKRKKHMMLLERDMAERQATEDRKKRLKLHTETIQTLFLTYFRILKNASTSSLLPCVLEGLAKFAHLINVDFFNDLFMVFSKLIDSGELSYRESFHCVQTAFTILSGQGTVLNIDPMVFYRHFYKNLFHIHAGTTSQDVSIVLECLDIMVSKRKRQVSQQRILAFIKRLITLTLQQGGAGCLGLLAAVRSLMTTYSYTDILLDSEACGSGVYLPEVEDPEHCNAHSATLWELPYLQRHYDSAVRKMSCNISAGAPTSGEGQLPVELRKAPVHLYTQGEAADLFPKHIPEKARKTKHKGRLNGLIQQDLQTDLLAVLHRVADAPKKMGLT